jgi:hypothetical protein
VPLIKRHAERGGDFLGQHRFARARLAFDQQRALERDRRVDGELEIVGGDVLRGAFEAHGCLLSENEKKPV